MAYEIILHPKTELDIEEAYAYYFSKGLRALKTFHKELENAQKALKLNPYFQIRYREYRCLPLKNIPYMLHFIIDEENKKVNVFGFICAFQNPRASYLK
jgi:toxin ParE1/3/4